MKRRIIVALVCCALLLSLPAYADGTKEYNLDDLGMKISVPSDYIVFLRDIDANDPNLSAYGLTKDSMSSLMKERNIYLNGWDQDANNEIIVTMIDSSLVDFNLYSNTTLSTLATSFESEYINVGITVINTEVYQHDQAKFLKIYISQPNNDSTVYGLQYYTVYADKAINITLQSYSGKITSTQEALLKGIVDSAEFNTAPQVADSESLPSSAFTYTDAKTKATFTVPANWVETPLTKERESIDVKFTSLEEEGMSIMYGSFDLWSEMSAEERSGCTRSNIDNSAFPKSDMADLFGVSSNEIRSVTYGGNEYYTATVSSKSDAYGLSLTVTITHMICIENGYMHWFQFSGDKSNEFYDDFESLLSSVNFPLSENTERSGVSGDPQSQFNFGNILFSLVVTIGVYSLPIFAYRYVIKKEPIGVKKAKKITIIYGICAFLVMSVIIFTVNGSGAAGGAILLWSYVNYRVLIGGKTRHEVALNSNNIPLAESGLETDQSEPLLQTDELDSIITSNIPQGKICSNCGTSMPIESRYCHRCGTKMI